MTATIRVNPDQIQAATPAPPLTVVMTLPEGGTGSPGILRLTAIDGEKIREIEANSLNPGDNGEKHHQGRVVFKFDGEAVRDVLGAPGRYRLSFQSEAVGGLGGVLYQGEAHLTLR